MNYLFIGSPPTSFFKSQKLGGNFLNIVPEMYASWDEDNRADSELNFKNSRF